VKKSATKPAATRATKAVTMPVTKAAATPVTAPASKLATAPAPKPVTAPATKPATRRTAAPRRRVAPRPEPPAGRRAAAPTATRPGLAVAVLVTAALLALLGATLPGMAIPSMHAALGASAPDLRLTVSLYLVAMGMAVPVAAGLGERLGAARLLRWSLATLVAASVLAGLSWNVGVLLGLRAVQGAAAGLLLPVAVALLCRIRPRAAGLAGLVGGLLLLVPALVPALGAWLAGHLEWRILPLATLPLGAAALTGARLSLPLAAGAPAARPDVAGMATAALALGSLLLALLQGGAWGWASPAVLGLLAVSAVSLALLAVVELSVPEPLVDPRRLRSPEALLVLSLLAVAVAELFAGLVEVPLLLQGAGATGGLQVGITLLLPAALAAGSMAAAPPLCARVGARWPVAAGLVAVAVTTYMLHGVPPSEVVRLVLWSSLRGAAVGLALTPLMAAAIVPAASVARAAAVTAVSVVIPAAAGLAVLGSALAVPAWSPGSQAAAATLPQRLVLLHGDVPLPLPGGTLLHAVLLTAALAALGAPLALGLPSGRRRATA
jgi:MFS family permease